MSDSAINQVEPHLPTIFVNEANGILQDLFAVPAISHMIMSATPAQVEAARNYIISIFEKGYRDGNLNVLGHTHNGNLYGYAFVFRNLPSSQIYCHKIFVHELYRGYGLGRQFISDLLSRSDNVSLICYADLISFYESVGMVCQGPFVVPITQGFELTYNIYAGHYIMSSSNDKDTQGIPIFMLNDDDIDKIVKAMGGCKD